MLRRSFLAISRQRSSVRRVPRPASTQVPPSLRFQRDFSSVPPKPGSTGKPPQPLQNFSKVLVGSIAVGTCVIAAYSGGYLDDFLGKKKQRPAEPSFIRHDNTSTEKLPTADESLLDTQNAKEPISVHSSEGSESHGSLVNETQESNNSQSAADSYIGSSNLKPEEVYTRAQVEEISEKLDDRASKAEELPNSSAEVDTPMAQNLNPQSQKNVEEQTSTGLNEASESFSTIDAGAVVQGNDVDKAQFVELQSQDETKDRPSRAPEQAASLLDTYRLREDVSEKDSSSIEHFVEHSSQRDKISHGDSEDLSDAYVSKDGKLIVDFLEAIHAAEQRQAVLDRSILVEQTRSLKEKYDKELKDARARELMYAEEVAILEKEIEKERAKAAAALKSLQERAEERLKMALEEKEREAESKLKELQDLAKAELTASIAREKAAQIERLTEANLNINALCMAFYARSEEARQTHSIHKLALGALALEDALSNGMPVQVELDALGVYIDGADKDSLLHLAVSSLPEDVRRHGTDSPLKLNQKFDALKGALRHFSLIPPDGGGILAHSLARVASSLKVKEADQSGDGIESVINKVESLLAQGKLVEAAEALEDGVKDSKATEVVGDWVRSVRNRAIAEQALILLQSYATSMSLT